MTDTPAGWIRCPVCGHAARAMTRLSSTTGRGRLRLIAERYYHARSECQTPWQRAGRETSR